MKTLFTTTYASIFVFLIIKIAMTVFQLSTVMHHNSLVAQLQHDRSKLSERQQQLQSQLASSMAIQAIESQASSEYIDITSPVVIKSDTILAARH